MKRPPKLCRNKHRNFAYITVSGKQVYLGKWGSEEAQAGYNRFLTAWTKHNDSQAAFHQISEKNTPLSELLVLYLTELNERPNINHSDLAAAKQMARRLRDLFADLDADDFGIRELEIFRDSFQIAGYERGGVHREYSRTYLNKIVKRVRAIFSWGAHKGLVDPATCVRLGYCLPLLKGRTTAPETPQREQVSKSDFDAVLPFLSPAYADFILLLRITGMRPSELCRMRICDIDRNIAQNDGVWVYVPAYHKTQSRGKSRFAALGKNAQEILLRHLADREPQEYVFSPRRIMAEKWEARRNNRKTKVQPSQALRDARNQTKRLERYKEQLETHSVGTVLKRACEKAIAAGTLNKPWSLYQLRHTAVTEVKLAFGAEAAQHFAGHSHLSTQDIYDHSALTKAIEVAKIRG